MTIAIVGFLAVLILVFLRMPIAIAMALVGTIGFATETNFKAAISMAGRLVIDTSQDYGSVGRAAVHPDGTVREQGRVVA